MNLRTDRQKAFGERQPLQWSLSIFSRENIDRWQGCMRVRPQQVTFNKEAVFCDKSFDGSSFSSVWHFMKQPLRVNNLRMKWTQIFSVYIKITFDLVLNVHVSCLPSRPVQRTSMVDRSIIGADPAFCVEDIQKAILWSLLLGFSCLLRPSERNGKDWWRGVVLLGCTFF